MQPDCITVSLVGLPEFRVLWIHESDPLCCLSLPHNYGVRGL